MRLDEKEILIIKETAGKVFGTNASIFLFGSRTDDAKRGGDIDLLIQCKRFLASGIRYKLKIKFLVALKNKLGDQKIDVLVEAGQGMDPVYRTALKTGILL